MIGQHQMLGQGQHHCHDMVQDAFTIAAGLIGQATPAAVALSKFMVSSPAPLMDSTTGFGRRRATDHGPATALLTPAGRSQSDRHELGRERAMPLRPACHLPAYQPERPAALPEFPGNRGGDRVDVEHALVGRHR